MFKNRSRIMTAIWATLALAVVGLWLALPENLRRQIAPTAHAATFTVNTADDHDDGVCNVADCTLREAINAVNAGSGGDTISFNIPGSGVHTINATKPFAITKAVTVDATTQPGFSGAPLIELNGAGAGANAIGLSVRASNVNIKGLIINRFSSYGITFDLFSNNSLEGCYVGTNAAGNAASGNGAGGIRINAANITIGGTTAGARNVISGNGGAGIEVLSGGSAVILGNFIGLNSAGTSGIRNFSAGISISGGSATVGGTAPGSRNVISGNGGSIIFFDGLNTTPAADTPVGIMISGGSGSQVIGNFIGTDGAGNGTIGNDVGILIDQGANNVIGGVTPGAGNLIVGSTLAGVKITGLGATNNIAQSNLIFSNGFDGVAISDGASKNLIGGTVLRAGNIIARNGFGGFGGGNGNGVNVISGTGNAILGNAIFLNSLLGVNVGPPGVTPNDNCEAAVGPAINPQNFPVITSATADSTTTTIRGTLNSAPNTQFRIEFFANSECDPSGNGEGQIFIGFTNVKTEASCVANFSFSVPNAAVVAPIITATATDANNNTSEFSGCATLVGIFPTIQFSSASYAVNEGDKHVDVTILRTTDASAAATVTFATSDNSFPRVCNVVNGIASSRCDYEPRMTVIKFAPGETSKTIPISIIDDSYAEFPETFNVKLSNPVGAILGFPSTGTVTITDNDVANGPNPIDTTEFFVRVHYLDFLNREPDAPGFDFWTNQITSCGLEQACIQLRRINVSASFFLSIEFQQEGYSVERIYKTAFGDIYGTSTFGGSHSVTVPVVRLDQFVFDTQQIGDGVIVGQTGWETSLENNKGAFALDFVQRLAFPINYPITMTPAQFVDKLFANAGITPSNADRNAAIAEFGSATNSGDAAARARALRDVAENSILISQEFNRAFVLMEYFAYLRRNPNDYPDSDYSGYDFWLRKLNQFNGDFQRAEMVKAFLTSSEYRSRFGQP